MAQGTLTTHKTRRLRKCDAIKSLKNEKSIRPKTYRVFVFLLLRELRQEDYLNRTNPFPFFESRRPLDDVTWPQDCIEERKRRIASIKDEMTTSNGIFTGIALNRRIVILLVVVRVEVSLFFCDKICLISRTMSFDPRRLLEKAIAMDTRFFWGYNALSPTGFYRYTLPLRSFKRFVSV